MGHRLESFGKVARLHDLPEDILGGGDIQLGETHAGDLGEGLGIRRFCCGNVINEGIGFFRKPGLPQCDERGIPTGGILGDFRMGLFQRFEPFGGVAGIKKPGDVARPIIGARIKLNKPGSEPKPFRLIAATIGKIHQL